MLPAPSAATGAPGSSVGSTAPVRPAIARGGYVQDRVFFLDEEIAAAAGYRPCARCMPEEYRRWKLTGNRNGAL
jgi:Metal binding domain of Ada